MQWGLKGDIVRKKSLKYRCKLKPNKVLDSDAIREPFLGVNVTLYSVNVTFESTFEILH